MEEDRLSVLPHELVVQILTSACLTGVDLARIAGTCTRFREISMLSHLWRDKFLQQWPSLKRLQAISIDWKTEYKGRHTCGLKLRALLPTLSKKCYLSEEVSESQLAELAALIIQQPLFCYYVEDELYLVIKADSSCSCVDLTTKYYARRSMEFLKRVMIKERFSYFLNKPDDTQHLEEGAMFISQWYQPAEDFRTISITSFLDKMAQDVIEHVCTRYPDHAANKLQRGPQSGGWCVVWPCNERRRMLECLSDIMHVKYGFQCNWDNYSDPCNSYLEQVIATRRGIPIALSIIYEAVARRVGVVCEPVSFPRHFLLRFLEKPHAEPLRQHTYIDCVSGALLTREACIDLIAAENTMTVQDKSFEPVGHKQVYTRMIQNLQPLTHALGNVDDAVHLRYSLEILWTLENHERCPSSTSEFRAVARSLPFDLAQCNIGIRTRNTEKAKSVAYSIGMVMLHKTSNCTCVIESWDPVCRQNNDWVRQMGMADPQHDQQQPFYYVLMDGGACSYVAEETLEPATDPQPIANPNVGRFFKAFNGKYYLPNAEKEIEYPDDLLRTQTYWESLLT